MDILITQKNQLFDLIQYYHIPHDKLIFKTFYWNREEREIDIKYQGADYFFSFKKSSVRHLGTGDKKNLFQILYSPDKEALVFKGKEIDYNMSWTQFLDSLGSWLSNLSRETNVEDKWELYFKQKEYIRLNPIEGAEYFSITEYQQLQLRTQILKERIQELNIPDDKLKSLESKLDELLEQSKNMRKINWRDLLIGTLMSYVIDQAIPPETAHQLWNMVQHSFTFFFLL